VIQEAVRLASRATSPTDLLSMATNKSDTGVGKN
jgi:hypothetical protein